MYTPWGAPGGATGPANYARTTLPGYGMEESPLDAPPRRLFEGTDGASGLRQRSDTKGDDIALPAVDQLPALEPLYPGQLQDRRLPMPTLDAGPIYNPPRRATMKLPKYHGEGLLETYFVQVQLAANFNGWSSEETGVQVALALEGKALQALMDLSPGQHASWPAIRDALQRRFGQRVFTDDAREKLANRFRKEGESLGAFAADLRFYTQRGYSTFADAEQEVLTLQAFVRGLRPERLREHIRLNFPHSLATALDEAERVEHVLCVSRHHIRQADVTGEIDEDEVVTRQAAATDARRYPRRSPGQQRRRDDGCYRCGEPGHVARQCLAPAPRIAPQQPALN